MLQEDSQEGPSFGGFSSYFVFLLPRSKEMVCISSRAWSMQKIIALQRASKLGPSSGSCIQKWGMGSHGGTCSSHRLRKCFPRYPSIPRGSPQPRHRAMLPHPRTLGLPGNWFKETRKFGRERDGVRQDQALANPGLHSSPLSLPPETADNLLAHHSLVQGGKEAKKVAKTWGAG